MSVATGFVGAVLRQKTFDGHRELPLPTVVQCLVHRASDVGGLMAEEHEAVRSFLQKNRTCMALNSTETGRACAER
jgi:hypothetical protein